MKVLHIVSGDLNLGAAKGALELHKGLLKMNVDSILLNNGSFTVNEKKILNLNSSAFSKMLIFFLKRIDHYIIKLLFKNSKSYFSTGFFGINFTNLEAYKTADIIHFHWINQGMVDLNIISKINKPIIWTIRDMWPFTGGCHYSLDCKKYIDFCNNCHILNSNKEKDLSWYVQSYKKKKYSNNITFVAISNWLKNVAESSSLLNKYNISVIPNNIDLNLFYPELKKYSFSFLKFNTNKKVILIGAINLNNLYKGFTKFIDALDFLDKSKYIICTFGNGDFKLVENKGFEVRNFNFINEYKTLRCLYSMSDVFVFPSLYEAFGKTIVESMSCGTPVVAFNNSGPKDLIDHKLNGYLADAFSSKSLSLGIEWVINSKKYNEISKAAIKKSTNFSNVNAANKYSDLYKKLLNF